MATTTLDRRTLLEQYRDVRSFTDRLAAPLSPEDQVAQSMPDASPVKWHRAHTTWFFEEFVCKPHIPGYECIDERYCYLYNSYYNAIGDRHPRPERGLQTRPDCGDVARYRAHVDTAIDEFGRNCPDATWSVVAPVIELGLQHEQQHQELSLMDIKHLFSRNAAWDSRYREHAPGLRAAPRAVMTAPLGWATVEGGLIDIGHSPHAGFAFDNEGPRHTVLLDAFRVANRLVTCGEWRDFVDDGGYARPELWLSDGWFAVQREAWDAPLYWQRDDGTDSGWSVLTLDGRRALVDAEPLVHVSHYEADAFARWAGARLPTEFEWEAAAASRSGASTNETGTTNESGTMCGAMLDTDLDVTPLHPTPADVHRTGIRQMLGDAWEWTASAYLPYPRFAPAPGAVGEYNGKFMSGQMVLRGGSAITPAGHIRPSYRNFFPPHARWMFSGVRLATDDR